MVRRRVEIKLIQNAAKRHTSFTKRRKGLEKKLRDFCDKLNAQAAMLTFSAAGNAFAFGNPSVDSVLDRYPDYARAENNGVEGRVDGGGGGEIEEGEALAVTEVDKRIAERKESRYWDGVVGDIGEIAAETEKMKIKMAARALEIAARGVE